MERIKSFFKTTMLGGILVVLPIVILFLVFKWLYDFVIDKLNPLTNILVNTARMQEFTASILALLIIIIIFFIVGLTVKTRMGIFTYGYLEKVFLDKLPLYKIIKETTLQLVGSRKTLFKQVALVNIFGNETLITAFVTDEHEDGSFTVFVPSGPAPTAGFIYHLKKEYVHKINYPIDKAMKTIFSLGAGSKELVACLNKNSDNNNGL